MFFTVNITSYIITKYLPLDLLKLLTGVVGVVVLFVTSLKTLLGTDRSVKPRWLRTDNSSVARFSFFLFIRSGYEDEKKYRLERVIRLMFIL